MSVSAYQKFKLKKILKELGNHKARHTELVTVLIPAGYDINKIINHLGQEQSTAKNIKSSSTRNNVIDALEKMIQHLRLYKQTPTNGLAVFSGNVAEREGQIDVKVWSLEPPIPLKTRIYRCEKDFQLEILFEMIEAKEVYGLVVLDARDADLALLKGKSIVPLTHTHSHVPGKMKAGGQSAVRFASNRALAVKAHLKKVADFMKEQFLNKELKGILVGGPGPVKYEFVDSNFITGDVKKIIIGIKDLSYTGSFGLEELVDRSQDILASEEIAEEKKLVTRFLEMLAKNQKLAAYGEHDVMKCIELGAAEVVMVSEVVDDEKIETFEAMAKQFGTEVKLISTDTREGVQLRDLGKFAAILRFEVDFNNYP
ncbi:peptide chain release factor 1 [Candidatus Woesearchaeota archaeon]|nr:peptide chain release factor 1 [Candidatus Woesearchaeota archaeon]